MKRFTIDAAWAGELVRQGVLVAVVLKWWDLTPDQQLTVISFLSLLVTGLVGMRTASSRVLENAGTSVEQVKAVAANPDAQMVPVMDGRRADS